VDLAVLESLPNIEPLDGLPDAWTWTTTPTARSYSAAVALSTDRGHVFECYAHDSFDEGLARAILDFARSHESELLAPPETLLVVADGFTHPGYRFDTVVSMSPRVHHFHEEHPEVHQVTRAVFAAYRCEFAGTENEDEVVYRCTRAAGVQPNVWNREPKPYLRMRYLPAAGPVIAQRGFTGAKALLRELTRLPDRENGFVEFENWQNRVWTVTWQDAYVVTQDGAEIARLDLDAVTEFAKDTLLGPNRSAGESSFLK
jgi:hypothetical protein